MIYPTQCHIFSGDEATINVHSGYTVSLTEASLVSVDAILALREELCSQYANEHAARCGIIERCHDCHCWSKTSELQRLEIMDCLLSPN